MTIGNIYDSFQSSYCYGIQKLPTIQPNEAKQAEKQNDAVLEQQAVRLGTTGSQENSTSLTKEETNPASRMANLDQVALTFNKEESFEYIGNDSSLDNLDMQKAISVMRKDQVLQGYQYFVGSSRNLIDGQQSEDGMVILKQ